MSKLNEEVMLQQLKRIADALNVNGHRYQMVLTFCDLRRMGIPISVNWRRSIR